MYIINTIAPVFVIIALGFALRRSGFLTGDLVKGINRLAYWVGLPALLFYKTATAPEITAAAGKSLVIVLIGTAACMLAAYVVAFIFRTPGKQTGAFVHGAFRGNLTFMGLAVILYAFSNADETTSRTAQTIAVLTIAAMVPIQNLLAVTVLLTARHRLNLSGFVKIAGQVATNPMLLACLTGIAFSLTPWELPVPAGRTLALVGQFALPVALLAIGGTLAEAKFAGRAMLSVIAAVIKVGLAPTLGYLAAVALNASPIETAVALIFLACPTAIASYILTDQLEGDATLASGAIVVSTVLSVVSLSVVLGTI
jgi:predicted permease